MAETSADPLGSLQCSPRLINSIREIIIIIIIIVVVIILFANVKHRQTASTELHLVARQEFSELH